MNFSTHKNRLIEQIGMALLKKREELISDFLEILKKSGELLKTDIFIFWSQQLTTTEPREIPITRFGLDEAKSRLPDLPQYDRNNLKEEIDSICERLFTYSNEEEQCSFQTTFHYYFHIPSQTVFKESELGVMEPKLKIENRSEIRIAKVSEVNGNREEFYQ